MNKTLTGHLTFHEKFSWRAEEFFDDPQVIALCRAIEASDLEEMERLIASGADVNARGQGDMTPLMWAFPDNKLERFKLLLAHGADPNVKFTTDLGVPSAFRAGDSVTTSAAKTRFSGYFEAVMEAGGDAIISDGANRPLIHVIIDATLADAIQRCNVAIRHGADLDQLSYGFTPSVAAVQSGQFDLCLYLLEQGADFTAYMSDELQRLIHIVVSREKEIAILQPRQRVAYQRLIDWLQAHGEDIDKAREDHARWANIPKVPGLYAHHRRAEVEARKQREKEERDQAEARVQELESKEEGRAPDSQKQSLQNPVQPADEDG